jgi:hypothetical protein
MNKQDLILQKKAQIAELIEGRNNNSQIKVANQKIREAQIHRDSLLKEWNVQIWELEKEIDQLKKGTPKPKAELSPKLQAWLDQYMRGVDWGYNGCKISWQSEDERYVIFTHVGSKQWSERGAQRYYASTHCLIDTQIECTKGMHAQSNKMGQKISAEIEGRLTKEHKENFMKTLSEYKEGLKHA